MADKEDNEEQAVLDHIEYLFRTQMSIPPLELSIRTPELARAAVVECEQLLALFRKRQRTVEALMKAAEPFMTVPVRRRQ